MAPWDGAVRSCGTNVPFSADRRDPCVILMILQFKCPLSLSSASMSNPETKNVIEIQIIAVDFKSKERTFWFPLLYTVWCQYHRVILLIHPVTPCPTPPINARRSSKIWWERQHNSFQTWHMEDLKRILLTGFLKRLYIKFADHYTGELQRSA